MVQQKITVAKDYTQNNSYFSNSIKVLYRN